MKAFFRNAAVLYFAVVLLIASAPETRIPQGGWSLGAAFLGGASIALFVIFVTNREDL